jgi:hypothetical protein
MGVVVDDVAHLQRLMTGRRAVSVGLVRDGRLMTIEVRPAEID